MPFIPVLDPGLYAHVISRPQPTIVHFWDSEASPPTPEFQILESGNYPGSELEAFFVDLSRIPVPNAPSKVPVTILFSQNTQLDTADTGDMDKFVQLLQQAAEQGL
ncbi:hypothetical protein BDV38DRAFT_257655 [Aspergillus pseudotamarii]|uniref:Thioredoxin-like protein n=1 Tax=Aspergillus pseudotamarii TaxID=132259 RepID=A0A5N6SG86_ASPPS|nr:uncharacterized protein BDV38DRAFT_257655 [Aspergillus pseudotamarii]KAE8133682.1 hypothetical protein BDV38DRAFT_257655 [Aspergillus pseudotamarii]